MFGSFDRTVSFFQNSDLMATGRPGEDELALLEPFRARLPAEVFGEAVMPPKSDGSGEDRKLLREATRLLREAGWSIQGGRLRNAEGEDFTIEFLDDDNSLERHTAPLIKNLSRLGIQASYRVVDAAQFQARTDAYEFDMLVRRYSLGATPGEDLRGSFSSKAAATKGTYNLAGIADPVVDALIETIIAAPDTRGADGRLPRARPRAAGRALLDPAMVQGGPLARLLGCLRPSRRKATLRPRRAGHLVVEGVGWRDIETSPLPVMAGLDTPIPASWPRQTSPAILPLPSARGGPGRARS